MAIRDLLLAVVFSLSAGVVLAQAAPGGGSGQGSGPGAGPMGGPMGGHMGGPGGPGGRMSPEEREKLCNANPEKCAKIKEEMSKRKEMHEACQADQASEKCKGMRQQEREQREKFRDELRKKCDADPKACEEKKEKFRERMDERHERMQERREKTAPATK